MNHDCDDGLIHDLMREFIPELEQLRAVERWCSENHGCDDVPCSCEGKFEPVDVAEYWRTREVVLVPKGQKPPPPPEKPGLRLVWSRD